MLHLIVVQPVVVQPVVVKPDVAQSVGGVYIVEQPVVVQCDERCSVVV